MKEWIRKLIKMYMKRYTIDMLFYHDVRCMEKRRKGSRYMHYMGLDGRCHRAKVKWRHEEGYLVFWIVRGSYLGMRELDIWKQYKFISIWLLEERHMGLTIVYKNPCSSYKQKNFVIL